MTEQATYERLGFTDEEWGLLVGLPHAVLTAASAAENDSTRRTMAEGAAGQEAISLGRESASTLVAAIANELLSRVGDPEAGEELPVIEPEQPVLLIEDTLERAQAASTLLTQRVDEGEAGAYRHWLVSIAEDVVTAAPSGGMLGLGGEQVTESERTFRDQLSAALVD